MRAGNERPWHAAAWCLSLGLVHALQPPELRRASIDVVVGKSSAAMAALGEGGAFFAAPSIFDRSPDLRTRLIATAVNLTASFKVHYDYVPFVDVLKKCEYYSNFDPPAPTTSPNEVWMGSVSLAEREEVLCSGVYCDGGPDRAYEKVRDTLSKGHLFSTQNPVIFAGCRQGGLTLGAIVSLQTWILEDVHTESYCRVTKLYETPNHYELQLTSLRENLVSGTYYYRVELHNGAVTMTIEKEQIFSSWLLRWIDTGAQEHQGDTEEAVKNYMQYFTSLARGRWPSAKYTEAMFRQAGGEQCNSNGDCKSAKCDGGTCKGGQVCPLLVRRMPPKSQPPIPSTP